MQNSKPFPCPAWLGEEFLTAQELRACRTLFQTPGPALALTVLDLARLQAELATPGQSLDATYLDRCELERLASFSFAKRQLEWLGGRLAAKHAALTLLARAGELPTSYRELVIESDATGRPHLRTPAGATAELPVISISHSHGYAGGLAVRGHSGGLDLQGVTPQVLAVRDRFATREEQALLQAAPSLAGQDEALLLTLLWSAKESLRKAMVCQPLLGFTEVTLTRLEAAPLAGLIGYFTCRRLGLALAPVFLVHRHSLACAITLQPPSQNTT